MDQPGCDSQRRNQAQEVLEGQAAHRLEAFEWCPFLSVDIPCRSDQKEENIECPEVDY